MIDATAARARVAEAAQARQLSPEAAANIAVWLERPHLAEYRPALLEHIEQAKWQQLNDVFFKTIEFGTGGRRGRLYAIGCNAINDRTIGESAQGLADWIRTVRPGKELRCAIAYDTRHRSPEFARLCTEIMLAAGIKVAFLEGYRSTPELSFAVRRLRCDCGIMITASHNPPTDNAVKVYGPTGGQLVPPEDKDCIGRMESVSEIRRRPFDEGVANGQIEFCQDEVDRAYWNAVVSHGLPGPTDLKIIYSPLHGVGASAILPVLKQAGFADVELFGPHAEPSPDFPNVPNHVANPENPKVFTAIIERADETGAELILASDPDADRLGSAVPRTLSRSERRPWETPTGNQVGALLTDFLLAELQRAGKLTPQHYVVKTLVTTELIHRIADHYGVAMAGDLLVGFRWIAKEIDDRGPENFVFGAEESYGFLAGDHVRDKDSAVAALLLSQLAARLKTEGRTLCDKLDDLYRQFGCHTEGQINVQMPGAKGMEDMVRLMAGLRSDPPRTLAGSAVVGLRDYAAGVIRRKGKPDEPIRGVPKGDMLFFELAAEGNYVAARPSGTEPKVKFYTFAYDPPEASRADLDAVKAAQRDRLAAMDRELREIAAKYAS